MSSRQCQWSICKHHICHLLAPCLAIRGLADVRGATSGRVTGGLPIPNTPLLPISCPNAPLVTLLVPRPTSQYPQMFPMTMPVIHLHALDLLSARPIPSHLMRACQCQRCHFRSCYKSVLIIHLAPACSRLLTWYHAATLSVRTPSLLPKSLSASGGGPMSKVIRRQGVLVRKGPFEQWHVLSVTSITFLRNRHS